MERLEGLKGAGWILSVFLRLVGLLGLGEVVVVLVLVVMVRISGDFWVEWKILCFEI